MSCDVVKVIVNNSNRKKIYSVNKHDFEPGDYVVLEADKGEDFGQVCSNVFPIDGSKVDDQIKKVIRKATKKDISENKQNQIESKKALENAKNIAKRMELNMNFLTAYYAFDRRQLVFNFMAEDRIDFRELAKKLASIYKTRIELRQIGVRDKAKEVGGLGPCGRFLCCNLFLNDFDSVSINMAKNQYISLKPDKINGICGRLLCCLNYEDQQYTEEKKKYPQIGSTIKYKNQRMKVTSLNLFENKFVAENSDGVPVTIGLDEYESKK